MVDAWRFPDPAGNESAEQPGLVDEMTEAVKKRPKFSPSWLELAPKPFHLVGIVALLCARCARGVESRS
jgi:hypothetical protein